MNRNEEGHVTASHVDPSSIGNKGIEVMNFADLGKLIFCCGLVLVGLGVGIIVHLIRRNK